MSSPNPARHLRRLRAPLALTLLTLAPLAARAAAGAASLRDGVVVDGAGAVAYLMHPQGGIAALDLRTGAQLWRSTEAERPLAVTSGQLVAQVRPGSQGELRIVTLDPARQGARSSEAALLLPEGVRAETAETLQHFFHLEAAPAEQGIVLRWYSEPRPSLATRTLDHIGRSGSEEVAGAKRVPSGGWQGTALFSPQAGRLTPLDAPQAKRQALAVQLAVAQDGTRTFTSVDSRYLLSSRPAAAGSEFRYIWTISEAGSGRSLGSIGARTSMSPFVVVDNLVVHVVMPRLRVSGGNRLDEPLRLRAVDLTSGQEIWSRAMRDPEYRGPTPD